jgi:hypothetical protein
MRKFVVTWLVLFLFAGTAYASINGDFEGNPVVRVYSAGKEIVAKDVPAVLLNGRTMVPIYMLRELGATVTWDQETYSVDVSLPVQTVVQQLTVKESSINVAQLAKEAKAYGVDFVGYFDDGNGTSQIKYYLGENLFEFLKDENKWNYVTYTGAYTYATFLEIEDEYGNYFNVPTKALRDYYDERITADELVAQYHVFEGAVNTVQIQTTPTYNVPPTQQTYQPIYQQEPIYDNTKVCEKIKDRQSKERSTLLRNSNPWSGRTQQEIKDLESRHADELAQYGCQ